ncbi:MAG TPA: nuclear transport factor 2 family protein [Dehalococcoidia bacterium]|nr:nuclear transport factor 2 family protein [Dehalococcoidia bacterium]
MHLVDITPEDRAAIYATLREYARCLDLADGDGVGATFTRDGTIETTNGGNFTGLDGMREFVRNAATMTGFSGRQHHMQPMLIEPTDEGYLVTSYWKVVTSHAGKPPFFVGLGWYKDRYVKQDGAWRCKHKQILQWNMANAPLFGSASEWKSSRQVTP